MADETHVEVKGLTEMLRAMRRIDSGASRELTKALRTTVGGAFVRDVQERIESVGLVQKGTLRKSIKAGTQSGQVVIRSSPPLKPGKKSRQGYAAVYEYGYGQRRAFLAPTLEQWEASGKLETELTGYLNWIENEWRAAA